jgi:hypothetical protein
MTHVSRAFVLGGFLVIALFGIQFAALAGDAKTIKPTAEIVPLKGTEESNAPTGASPSSASQPRKSFINLAALTDAPGIPVAIKAASGDDAATFDLLAALDVPLHKGFFQPSFYKEGLFDRLLSGEVSDLRRLNLPERVERILLVRLGEPKRHSPQDSEEATQLSMAVTVTAFDVRARSVLKTLRFDAAGVAFDNEQMLHESLREDIARNLQPLKTIL